VLACLCPPFLNAPKRVVVSFFFVAIAINNFLANMQFEVLSRIGFPENQICVGADILHVSMPKEENKKPRSRLPEAKVSNTHLNPYLSG
jgi:hypothetical protein